MYLFLGVRIVRDEAKFFNTWCTNFFILPSSHRERMIQKRGASQKNSYLGTDLLSRTYSSYSESSFHSDNASFFPTSWYKNINKGLPYQKYVYRQLNIAMYAFNGGLKHRDKPT